LESPACLSIRQGRSIQAYKAQQERQPESQGI
jgi:hypothetical protein